MWYILAFIILGFLVIIYATFIFSNFHAKLKFANKHKGYADNLWCMKHFLDSINSLSIVADVIILVIEIIVFLYIVYKASRYAMYNKISKYNLNTFLIKIFLKLLSLFAVMSSLTILFNKIYVHFEDDAKNITENEFLML